MLVIEPLLNRLGGNGLYISMTTGVPLSPEQPLRRSGMHHYDTCFSSAYEGPTLKVSV